MKPLIIQDNTSTLKIVFDNINNIFEISGNSLPEDVIEFYAPVLLWVEEYNQQINRKSIEINVKLSYINSASAKVILTVFELFEQGKSKNSDIQINWFYNESDDDMHSMGKEFKSKLNLHFNFIATM